MSEQISNCCTAPIQEDSDVCSACFEHCGDVEESLSDKRQPIIATEKGKSFVINHSYHEEDVKECFKKLIEEGEVLKNGAFVINYKKFKELIGPELI